MDTLIAAVVQLTSTAEVARNLDRATALVRGPSRVGEGHGATAARGATQNATSWAGRQ